MTARTVMLCVCMSFMLVACGKKPAQLQPLVAPLGADPAYYPFPKIQTPPPAPAPALQP